MPKKTKPVKAPRARRESNEEFLAARRARSEAGANVDAAATGMLAAIAETDGAEIPREQWPLAEVLVARGLITLGSPRGPGGDWRRAELVGGRRETHEEFLAARMRPQALDPRASFPEHDKLSTVKDKSQACGEFVEWLQQRYTFGEYHTHSKACQSDDGSACGSSTRILYPASINVRRLLAEFFEIDETKLEDEKRAMLAQMQGRR